MILASSAFYGSSRNYCAEALALFARMSSPPTFVRKYLINRLILALKDADAWTRFDGFYVFKADAAQAALLNWVASGSATNTGSLPFTANVGYVGDGTNALVGAVNSLLTINNQHLGTYTSAYSPQTDAGDGVISVGSENRINNSYSTTLIRTFSSSSAAVETAGTVTGHVALSRSSSAGYEVYSQGVQVAAPVEATNLFIGGSGQFLAGCGSGVTLNAGHYGSALTSTQMAAVKAALANYMAGL